MAPPASIQKNRAEGDAVVVIDLEIDDSPSQRRIQKPSARQTKALPAPHLVATEGQETIGSSHQKRYWRSSSTSLTSLQSSARTANDQENKMPHPHLGKGVGKSFVRKKEDQRNLKDVSKAQRNPHDYLGESKPLLKQDTRKETLRQPSEDKINALEEEIKDLKKALKNCRSKITKQDRQLKDEAEEIRQLGLDKLEDSKKHGRSLTKIRGDYHKKIRTGPIAQIDDNQMRAPLSKLHDICREWAKKHSISQADLHKISSSDRSAVMKLAQSRYRAVSRKGEALLFTGGTNNGAELLLNAALNHILWFEVLVCPWHFLLHAEMVDGPSNTVPTILWLLSQGVSGGETAKKNAYLWLGMLLKAMSPTSTVEQQTDEERAWRGKLQQMKKASFDKMVQELNHYCECLFKKANQDEIKQRRDRLYHIFRTAHDVAQKLWTQGYRVDCLGRQQLSSVYEAESSSATAHLSMRIEEKDASRDGEEIFLVTTPGITACGDEAGDFSESTKRVLDAAEVCFATKEELAAASSEWQKRQDTQSSAIVSNAVGAGGADQSDIISETITKSEPASSSPAVGSNIALTVTNRDDLPDRGAQPPSRTILRPSAVSFAAQAEIDHQSQAIGLSLVQVKSGKYTVYEGHGSDAIAGSRKRARQFIELCDPDEPTIRPSAETGTLGDNTDISALAEDADAKMKKKRPKHLQEST